ncbi:MAG: HAD-IIB family hydrolase [Candidatus Ancillula sp.]|jgi:HAD superfamily hydrolase (TIGR01484 family)|nr:HAD-IIB family hydrolase [Candidatus Ancillula sp.]
MEISQKKLIIFDLDGTLTKSKTPIREEMCELLYRLLREKNVVVISGGKREMVKRDLENPIVQYVHQKKYDFAVLKNLHIMPTYGTSYFVWGGNINSKPEWLCKYSNYLTSDQKERTFKILEEIPKKMGYWEPENKIFGERVEDRESQITYSPLGQDAAREEKAKYDVEDMLRDKVVQAVQEKLPDLEVRKGGLTSIDVTEKGVDKTFGVKKMMQMYKYKIEDMLFVADKIYPGGNDYPIKEFGVESIEVQSPEETEKIIEGILNDN